MAQLQQKWNQRYQSAHAPNQVIHVLQNNMHLLPQQGRVLDLACGLGGNALRLAGCGYETHAWDISDQAMEKLAEFAQERKVAVHTRQCDVCSSPPERESFDVIVVSYFLYRPLIPVLIKALKPGGILYYQTFVEESIGITGPKNSAYRLVRNELLQLCNELTIRFYREEGTIGDVSKGYRNEAMLVGQKLPY